MNEERSLSEVHSSVTIPEQRGFLRRLFAFAGPAYLVAVGYMDPGNWATDIAAGSRYGYALVWVLVMSNAMAILLQSLSARLGLVSGRDLAQACRDRYPASVNVALWILCEVAIAACDLAEVIGSAIGLQLLFGIPLIYGVLITALDTFLILFLHQAGIRKMEAFILVLVATIAGCFLFEILVSRPDLPGIARGVLPSLPDSDALYFAIGILGATVMPHNLYLHSSLVQSRRVEKTARGIHQSLKFNLIDSVVALNLALFINAAILIMAAAVFHRAGLFDVAAIQDAHQLLAPIVGSALAPILFAVALISAGQSSTITGTLAGQIVMEGYVNIRLRPWLRRIVTRAVAIVPAVLTIVLFGDRATGELLVLSQVVLSLQLSFAVIPLIHMVSDRKLMGAFAIRPWVQLLAWTTAGIIVVLNAKLVIDEVGVWMGKEGTSGMLARYLAIPVIAAVGFLLLFVLLDPFFLGRRKRREPADVHKGPELEGVEPARPFGKVAAALDFGDTDAEVLSRAAALAASAKCPLLLIHVVESAGALALGRDIGDTESRADLERLKRYAIDLGKYDVNVEVELGFGSPVRVLPEMVERHRVELLVVGAHGHRGVTDWLYGSTIDELRHRLNISVLVVGRPGPEP
ncbi:MAG TPA: Nramp family divalent metal transporter [Candidatus Deferrimicrobiaceae bacterium]|nr:Nramp family divalent metal transporter [Candidatus Deferrimicrobiaceae bacterium]